MSDDVIVFLALLFMGGALVGLGHPFGYVMLVPIVLWVLA